MRLYHNIFYHNLRYKSSSNPVLRFRQRNGNGKNPDGQDFKGGDFFAPFAKKYYSSLTVWIVGTDVERGFFSAGSIPLRTFAIAVHSDPARWLRGRCPHTAYPLPFQFVPAGALSVGYVSAVSSFRPLSFGKAVFHQRFKPGSVG